MVLRWDISNHPAISGPLDAALRSMTRPEATGLRKLFTDTLESAPIITHGGIYVEEGGRFEADIERIYAVVARTVRGLHYHKTGVPIPIEQPVMVLADEFLEQSAPVIRNQIILSIQPMIQGEPDVIGNETFLFFWKGDKGQPTASKWFLVFFSRAIYYAATAPQIGGT